MLALLALVTPAWCSCEEAPVNLTDYTFATLGPSWIWKGGKRPEQIFGPPLFLLYNGARQTLVVDNSRWPESAAPDNVNLHVRVVSTDVMMSSTDKCCPGATAVGTEAGGFVTSLNYYNGRYGKPARATNLASSSTFAASRPSRAASHALLLASVPPICALGAQRIWASASPSAEATIASAR